MVTMSKEKLLEKLGSFFKEELWGRIEPKDIGISKFKILDDLFMKDMGPTDTCQMHANPSQGRQKKRTVF